MGIRLSCASCVTAKSSGVMVELGEAETEVCGKIGINGFSRRGEIEVTDDALSRFLRPRFRLGCSLSDDDALLLEGCDDEAKGRAGYCNATDCSGVSETLLTRCKAGGKGTMAVNAVRESKEPETSKVGVIALATLEAADATNPGLTNCQQSVSMWASVELWLPLSTSSMLLLLALSSSLERSSELSNFGELSRLESVDAVSEHGGEGGSWVARATSRPKSQVLSSKVKYLDSCNWATVFEEVSDSAR